MSLSRKILLLNEEIEQTQREIGICSVTRICRYRNCKKEFETDSKIRWFCCPEHYKLENRERTRDKNIEYKQMKQAALSLAISEQDSV